MDLAGVEAHADSLVSSIIALDLNDRPDASDWAMDSGLRATSQTRRRPGSFSSDASHRSCSSSRVGYRLRKLAECGCRKPPGVR